MASKLPMVSVDLSELNDKPRWYTVVTLFNYEQKFADDLIQGLDGYRLHDKIVDVFVPIKTEISKVIGKNGKVREKTTKEKIYPNYVFVKALLDEETWAYINKTTGCSTVLAQTGKPIPVSEMEMETIKSHCGYVQTEEQLDFDLYEGEVGDHVKIVYGPFEGYTGKVTKLNGELSEVLLDINNMRLEISGKYIERK